jgi:hypothetical protein
LWHNLAGPVENAAIRHHRCVSEHVQTELSAARAGQVRPTQPVGPRECTYASRVWLHHQRIHGLLEQRHGIRAISRRLGLARGPVRRFGRAAGQKTFSPRHGAGPRQTQHRRRLRSLPGQRLTEGFLTTTQLFKEIKAFGYQGTYETLRQYVKPMRELHPARRGSAVPKARHIAGWQFRHPDTLQAKEQITLKRVRAIVLTLTGLPYTSTILRRS